MSVSDGTRTNGSVVPFVRRWHVIHEVDLVPLTADHARMAALCDRLEACADELPTRPPRDIAEALCEELTSLLASHDASEQALLTALFERDHRPIARAVLQRIRDQHLADSVHAQDLVSALAPEPDDRMVSTDALGYMLRCFFDGCRRAMRFEELALLVLAGDRLTPDALALVGRSLCRDG